MAELSIKVPIRFSEKAQKDLYETCMAYKELAEMRGDENERLRELVREIWRSCPTSEDDCARCPHRIEESDEVWCDIPILMVELGVEVDG